MFNYFNDYVKKMTDDNDLVIETICLNVTHFRSMRKQEMKKVINNPVFKLLLVANGCEFL